MTPGIFVHERRARPDLQRGESARALTCRDALQGLALQLQVERIALRREPSGGKRDPLRIGTLARQLSMAPGFAVNALAVQQNLNMAAGPLDVQRKQLIRRCGGRGIEFRAVPHRTILTRPGSRPIIGQCRGRCCNVDRKTVTRPRHRDDLVDAQHDRPIGPCGVASNPGERPDSRKLNEHPARGLEAGDDSSGCEHRQGLCRMSCWCRDSS